MQLLLSLAVVMATLGPIQPQPVPAEVLKQLSLDGEKLVGEELRAALYGVKQMKEVMWRNAQKHQHLMTSLDHSIDKKKGAAQLARDVTDKLQEAEEQCRDSLKEEWEACRPCLEDACKTFYTSTCRRGFTSFQAKVENFFRRVSKRFGPREAVPVEEEELQLQQGPDDSDTAVLRIKDSFSHLVSRVGSVVSRSETLVSRMKDRMDQVLQQAFLGNTSLLVEEAASDPYSPARDSGFLQGVGLDEVLDSFFDFGKSVVEEFGAVVTQVFDNLQETVEEQEKRAAANLPGLLRSRNLCRDLRRQTSECWQLQSQCEVCQGDLLSECPSVRELHGELDEASQLVEVSREQYEEILSIVQRHTDETVTWLGSMADQFGWVARTVADPGEPNIIFQITRVAPKGSEANASESETRVEVNIFNSSPLLLSVPGELDLQDPAFIQYVTQEALNKHKAMVRSSDDV
ncbi:clusterin-like protein 1 isoform X1 [Synchiropus splendidus]|uniref:clusterin-like protein 1 isoform X1 n=1 Tax=Synchiropus splendidus TaxID=270530 RepID=UPI00237DCEEA|nr:clusterin-like protein 1 isoform X1 [Synchiropus splendidus]